VRTTLTIDDDIAAALERLRTKRRVSLRPLVNDALRRGLREFEAPRKERTAFRTRSVSLGRLLVPSVENIAEVLAVHADPTLTIPK
jgi:hypothetical protein